MHSSSTTQKHFSFSPRIPSISKFLFLASQNHRFLQTFACLIVGNVRRLRDHLMSCCFLQTSWFYPNFLMFGSVSEHFVQTVMNWGISLLHLSPESSALQVLSFFTHSSLPSEEGTDKLWGNDFHRNSRPSGASHFFTGVHFTDLCCSYTSFSKK